MTQLEALNNAATSANIQGLSVLEAYQNDKRKTIPLYCLVLGNETVSPKLNYDKMNHFILGFNKALKLFKPTI